MLALFSPGLLCLSWTSYSNIQMAPVNSTINDVVCVNVCVCFLLTQFIVTSA